MGEETTAGMILRRLHEIKIAVEAAEFTAEVHRSTTGTTAASVGILRPRRTGIQRGTTSPQVETSPIAVKATNSEKIDNRITYSSIGSQDGTPPRIWSRGLVW